MSITVTLLCVSNKRETPYRRADEPEQPDYYEAEFEKIAGDPTVTVHYGFKLRSEKVLPFIAGRLYNLSIDTEQIPERS